MTFRKDKKVQAQANSIRNLNMRQQFGIKMMELLISGRRILNIDETWINQTNFRRQSWHEPHNH